jgi:hypothetical protein
LRGKGITQHMGEPQLQASITQEPIHSTLLEDHAECWDYVQ